MSQMTAAGTVYSSIQSTASGQYDQYVLTWAGLAESYFDGYSRPATIDGSLQPEQVQQFTADTTDWPHRIQWGNSHKNWIKVTINPTMATNDVDSQRVYGFYYRWTGNYPTGYPDYQHIDDFTVNFAPIPEDKEIAPETFLRWLEHIGHDDAFLRVSYKMQKKMMKAVGHIPPWDPRKIAELEKQRDRFRNWLALMPEDQRKLSEDKLEERWGIREIPPITPELLDQIEANSRQFLEECLSPDELGWYDEHGHIKVRSEKNSNVYYIIKVEQHGSIERWVNGEHEENVCYQTKWGGLPFLDVIAMKVLHCKYNEKEVLKVGNRTRIVPTLRG